MVTNYVGYFAKVWRKKNEKHELALFHLFGKEDVAYYFLRSCLLGWTENFNS